MVIGAFWGKVYTPLALRVACVAVVLLCCMSFPTELASYAHSAVVFWVSKTLTLPALGSLGC
jgi:hypothetical protein